MPDIYVGLIVALAKTRADRPGVGNSEASIAGAARVATGGG